MASHCRNRGEEEPVQVSSNRFEDVVRVIEKIKKVKVKEL